MRCIGLFVESLASVPFPFSCKRDVVEVAEEEDGEKASAGVCWTVAASMCCGVRLYCGVSFLLCLR